MSQKEANNYKQNSPYNDKVRKIAELLNIEIEIFYVMKNAIGITFKFKKQIFHLGVGHDMTSEFFNEYSEIVEINFEEGKISVQTSKEKINSFLELIEGMKLPKWPGEANKN